MFEPKENVLNIHSMDDIFARLDEICDNEKSYTDKELNDKIHQVYDFCSGGETGGSFYFITHSRSEKLCEKRAKKYCKKHKIKLEDYPYGIFSIDVLKPEPMDEKSVQEWFDFHFKKDTLLPKSRNDNEI